jgi:3D (Asp-Asp-Asp) domain-containing protein
MLRFGLCSLAIVSMFGCRADEDHQRDIHKSLDLTRETQRIFQFKIDPDVVVEFNLPKRILSTPVQTLWATYYYTPRLAHVDGGYDLLDMNGTPLGPQLPRSQWCSAAMEGSVQILFAGKWQTYNYAGSTGVEQVDCSSDFKHPVGRSRFKEARGPWGDGVKNFILSPYRTLAVDPAVIPYGSVVYIDAARGQRFTTPDGVSRVHDGYFFAADTGGLIRGRHVDVYIGVDKKTPFSWITSNANANIAYQVVPDKDIQDALLQIHLF